MYRANYFLRTSVLKDVNRFLGYLAMYFNIHFLDSQSVFASRTGLSVRRSCTDKPS
jgi:hypothetical protein